MNKNEGIISTDDITFDLFRGKWMLVSNRNVGAEKQKLIGFFLIW